MRKSIIIGLWLIGILLLTFITRLSAETFASHPPMRPLPTPSARPMTNGPASFVDAQKGNDQNDGSKEKPWKTIQQAVAKLKPGSALYLRGGIYWEHVTVSVKGTAEGPITIRSFPGELAIVDGGFREFLEHPADAWEPYPDGGEGEYRSKKSYAGPDIGGNFGDSMVPFRLYGNFVDSRSKKQFEDRKQKDQEGTYVGPGVIWDRATGRIHIRLSHTTLKWLGDENYRGETDPRKLPLVIASSETTLTIKGSQHLRVEDVVIRGSSTGVEISKSGDLKFDGVTLYAVRYGMIVEETTGFKCVNSAFRGFDAPWHPRGSGLDVDCFCPLDLVTAESGSDFEFAYNEFTDHHDCFQIGDVDSVTFHHNLVDHFNDDGIDVDLSERLGTHHIFANRISQCTTAISIHDSVPANSEATNGVYIYRNIFDLRKGTYRTPPSSSDEEKDEGSGKGFYRVGNLMADHGSPIWPPIYFYQNTVLQKTPSWRAYYASGAGYAGLKQTMRRVFNNVFVHERIFEPGQKNPGPVLPPKPAETDLQVDGNLFWGTTDGASFQGDYFAKVRQSKTFEESKKQYPPGWAAHDVFGDPKFARWTNEQGASPDLSLQKTSPAINAGVKTPADWLDSLREQDKGAPDIGALPLGVAPWKVGVNGRMPVLPQNR